MSVGLSHIARENACFTLGVKISGFCTADGVLELCPGCAAGWTVFEHLFRFERTNIVIILELIMGENHIIEYWESIKEYEIDSSWKNYRSEEYFKYRDQFELAQKREFVGDFPLSIEIEASYYCNLKCPYCPRVANLGERELGHMSTELWEKILTEAKANMPTILRMNSKSTFDCSLALVIPKLGVNKMLPSSGTTDFQIAPQPVGSTINATCSMGMYSFQLRFI